MKFHLASASAVLTAGQHLDRPINRRVHLRDRRRDRDRLSDARIHLATHLRARALRSGKRRCAPVARQSIPDPSSFDRS